jgi:glyoxylate reductase
MVHSKPLIVVTRPLLRQTVEQLESLGQLVVLGEDGLATAQSVLKRAQVLVSTVDDIVDSEIIDALEQAVLIANYAVGVNNVDLARAEAAGIFVSNTPDVLTDATADFAFALMLAAARRLPEGERLVRSGAFRGWSPNLLLGVDVHHKTLGIVGYGRIGQAVAKRARGFDMRVLFCSHDTKKVQAGSDAQQVDLETLLHESDFVSLHVPLTDATYHLLGEHNIAKMKRTAVLVNTSRGPIVDEEALASALTSRWIAAAGLDVYEQEPEVHPRLLGLDNVVLAPHLGSATLDARLAMGQRVVDNTSQVLQGKPPLFQANAPQNPRIGNKR